MEWIDGIAGATVGLDTAPLIYFIEERVPYLSVLEVFWQNGRRVLFGCNVDHNLVGSPRLSLACR